MTKSQEELQASPNSKSCKVSQFTADNLTVIAEFTYYIGNRHLPLYINAVHNLFWVEFDEKIHHQLMHKFPQHISIEQVELHDGLLIRKNFESMFLDNE